MLFKCIGSQWQPDMCTPNTRKSLSIKPCVYSKENRAKNLAHCMQPIEWPIQIGWFCMIIWLHLSTLNDLNHPYQLIRRRMNAGSEQIEERIKSQNASEQCTNKFVEIVMIRWQYNFTSTANKNELSEHNIHSGNNTIVVTC